MVVEADGIILDYSRQRATPQTMVGSRFVRYCLNRGH